MAPPQKVDHFSQKIQLNSRTKFVISSYTNVSPDVPIVLSQSFNKLLHAGFGLAFMQL